MVASVIVARDDITVVLGREGDETLLPLAVTDAASEVEARALSAGEDDELVVAAQRLVHGDGLLSLLGAATHLDGDDEGAEGDEVVEEFVDEEFDSVPFPVKDGGHGDAVWTAEGVVADKDVFLGGVELVEAVRHDGLVEVAHRGVGELHARPAVVVTQHAVHPVLMDEFLHQPDDGSRNRDVRELLFENLLDVKVGESAHVSDAGGE